MNKKIFLIVLLLGFIFIPISVISARTPSGIPVSEDGEVNNVGVRDTAADPNIMSAAPWRTYTEWNISEIPDTAIIDRIDISFRTGATWDTGAQLRSMQFQPSIAPVATVYADCANGTLYVTYTGQAINTNYKFTLPDSVITDFTANLAVDWFAIGWTRNGNTALLRSDDGGYPPTLTVYWHLTTDYSYNFSRAYYENGTIVQPAINITVTGPGFNEAFNTSTATSQYYPVEPTAFQWTITDGTSTATRIIYNTGPENITVTYPEALFDTFVFTIRDFTKKLSYGMAYLEAYRVINTTSTLIERHTIDIHNEVPLNLVIGATYTIRVRFYDGSYYDWGTFVPGDSTTFTIVLRGVAFSDRAYQVSNFITVDITRTGGTLFTVDYATTQNTTVWANVTIQIRNGAVVAQVSRTNNSFTYNYAGALANTSYIVLVEGEHTLLREWGYTRIFDATETYPDIPDLETIFPLGLLNATNLIGWILSVGAGGLTYSVNMKRGALIGMAVMASILTVFGFTDWSYYLLALIWFFAIIVYIGSSEKT